MVGFWGDFFFLFYPSLYDKLYCGETFKIFMPLGSNPSCFVTENLQLMHWRGKKIYSVESTGIDNHILAYV